MILALIDHDRGEPNEASLEMLGVARQLARKQGQPLEAVLVGKESRSGAGALPRYGAAVIHLVRHERLVDYAPEAWAASLAQLVHSKNPAAVVAPGTERGSEVMAHLAAKLDQPLAANCTEVEPGSPYEVTRYRWGSSILEEARLKGEPALLTIAPHAVAAEEVQTEARPTIEEFEPSLDEGHLRVKVTARQETEQEGVSLQDARVVIGGGRGVGGAEGFEMLEALAQRLGGAVGGSRVATNNGWRPHSDQIGLTGNHIAPDLYIACGISGAVQHMVGVKGAKRILVINKDEEAPILSKADYAVIGDLQEVIPALTEAVKQEQEPG